MIPSKVTISKRYLSLWVSLWKFRFIPSEFYSNVFFDYRRGKSHHQMRKLRGGGAGKGGSRSGGMAEGGGEKEEGGKGGKKLGRREGKQL